LPDTMDSTERSMPPPRPAGGASGGVGVTIQPCGWAIAWADAWQRALEIREQGAGGVAGVVHVHCWQRGAVRRVCCWREAEAVTPHQKGQGTCSAPAPLPARWTAHRHPAPAAQRSSARQHGCMCCRPSLPDLKACACSGDGAVRAQAIPGRRGWQQASTPPQRRSGRSQVDLHLGHRSLPATKEPKNGIRQVQRQAPPVPPLISFGMENEP
jgi:hypothetical protein